MGKIFDLFKMLDPAKKVVIKKSSTKKNKMSAKGKTRKQNGG